MKTFTQIEKLDYLLSEFKDLKPHGINYLIGILNAKNVRYETEEIKIALRKLMNDNYISEISAGDYKITFDGNIFIGYVKKDLLENERSIFLDQTQTALRKYNKRLLVATWFAGFTALLLFLWQVFLYFYPVHKDYTYWIWETIPLKKK